MSYSCTSTFELWFFGEKGEVGVVLCMPLVSASLILQRDWHIDDSSPMKINFSIRSFIFI